MEVVPNKPVPNVSGIATDTDLIQKIYSRCHIFYFSSQNRFPKDSWKDWGGGWGGEGGPLLAVTHWKMDELQEPRGWRGEKKGFVSVWPHYEAVIVILQTPSSSRNLGYTIKTSAAMFAADSVISATDLVPITFRRHQRECGSQTFPCLLICLFFIF